ncbi:MAG TPA: hypothetical protein VH352_05855 [Pseudonocardiaceae bacterium]|jgi:hypothetical protein|nr:hypothetical protein [Pseudonocardiaceae bacterium]
MSGKRIIMVGQSRWTFPDGDVADALAEIRSAMRDSKVAVLSLIDGDDRPVTVYLNGRTTETVMVDLGGEPRPSEIS